MMRAIPLLLAGTSAWAEMPPVPAVLGEPFDVLIEHQPGGEDWLILRYLLPHIAGGEFDYEAFVPELDRLCATAGLDRASELDSPPGQIVIVLMDRAVERGVADAEATQYIASYLPVDGECLWE